MLFQIPVSPDEGFNLPGPLGSGLNQDPTSAPLALTNIISTAIGVMTVIALIWFIIQFFISAIQIISSGGDKNALASAKSKLSTSVLGVVIVISAIFLIELIGTILGVSILNSIMDLIRNQVINNPNVGVG